MSILEELPQVSPDLTLQELSPQEFVVKLRSRKQYFSVGPEEAFLLEMLQTPQTRNSLKKAFKERFGERLSSQDIGDFLQLITQRGLLVGEQPAADVSTEIEGDDDEDIISTGKQSLLFYRIPLFDPNAKFNRWEPRLRWLWSLQFLIFSLGVIAFAGLVLWGNRGGLFSAFPNAVRWETFLIGWGVVIAATALHEVAHGMTCKHFGGDVHDTGILFMFFMPCLYCNVSDAWLIREKWKRMLITAAGPYCDLCVWALAVFVWRITQQDTLINYVAFVALTVCGTRSLLNFNPLLRLDGYYLVADWLSIPNLRKRAHEYWMGYLRWFLWGAERPKAEANGTALLVYGVVSWFFALTLLDVVFLQLLKYAGDQMGTAGIVMGLLLLMAVSKRVFKGFFRSEFMKMLTERPTHVMRWGIGIAAVAVALFVIPVRHYATGAFEVRSGERHQIAVPVAGFVAEVFVQDGQQVEANAPLVRLESTDLHNQIAVKQSELQESDAILRKLRAGPRPEEVNDQLARTQRLRDWVEMGQQELDRAKRRLEQELVGLEQRIAQTQAELRFGKASLEQSYALYRQGALAGAELRSEQTRLVVLESQLRQAESDKKVREVEGTRAAEQELVRRQQELADAESRLTLLKAGTRPEELAAEEARRQRLDQELAYLQDRADRLIVRAPADGTISSPRMQEIVGTFAAAGTPICTIEDASNSYIEISVPEEEVVGLKPGQTVNLKARAIPFETFYASVDHIATSTRSNPTAGTAGVANPALVVYCQLANPDGRLRTGMSGFGRVDRGWKSLGLIMATRALRYLRTEFWW